VKRMAIATALMALGIGTAFAQTDKIGDILVAHPWAPPMSGPKLTNSAAYMRLTDQGSKPDELISASTPVAQKVELHVFNVENGVYGMHPVHAIEVSPGAASTVLRPGGAHVMLERLKEPLKVGETFPLTLTFKNAGQLRVEVEVRSPQVATANASD
jgi:periplasmic copper chaperone A